MVRIVYAPESCRKSLQQYAAQENVVIGLILGQSCESMETVIHVARTPERADEDATPGLCAVQPEWVAEHAVHVTRMLPGGCYVLGIFSAGGDAAWSGAAEAVAARALVAAVRSALSADECTHLCGVGPRDLLLAHVTALGEVSLRSADPSGWGAAELRPARSPWVRLHCYHEFDDLMPLVRTAPDQNVSVKQQFQEVISHSARALGRSVMFVEGELRDSGDTLETLLRRHKPPRHSSASAPSQPAATAASHSLTVSLFVPTEVGGAGGAVNAGGAVEYVECCGSVHVSGCVGAAVWLPARVSVGEAGAAMRADVLRSLAARVRMHCDALVDDALLPEEKACLNEPPRRVLLPLPCGGGVAACDYLFPGEATAEALLSVRELLDLRLAEPDVIADLETPADTSEWEALEGGGGGRGDGGGVDGAGCSEGAAGARDAAQVVYMCGAAGALLVLLLSVVLHYRRPLLALFTAQPTGTDTDTD